MQVYRGLPILTNQSPARLVGIWPLDHEASVAEYQDLAHAAIDEILAAGRTPFVVGRDRPLPAGRNRRSHAAAGARTGRARALGAVLRRAGSGARARAPRRARSGGGRGRPSQRPPPRRARASSSPAGTRQRDQLWAGETRHPTIVFGLDVPKEELDRRIAERTRAMFEAGVRAEAEAALAGSISPTAAYAHGLSDLAEQPDDEAAIEALVARTRRYAAYQRKWMRRIPGLVSLPADRPPGEIADAILEVARARQRLPAGRAG